MEKHQVRGCKVGFGHVESWPLRLQEDIDRAQWFGVYRNHEDGTQQSVADLNAVEDARALAAWLEAMPATVARVSLTMKSEN